MTNLILYRYPLGDLSAVPVIGAPEELISFDPDDNHCTGDNLFDIYGRGAKIRILRDGFIFNGWIVPGEGYRRARIDDSAFDPPKRVFTDYLDYVFAIRKDTTDVDGVLLSSENIFMGMARVEDIHDNEEQNEVDFTIYDALWVWIKRAKEWTLSSTVNTPLNMDTTDYGGMNTLGELLKAPLRPLNDFMILSFRFNLDSSIYFENEKYVIEGYANDFNTWTYKRLFAGGWHNYTLINTWVRIDPDYGSSPDPNYIKVVMCKLYKTVVSATINIYFYAVRYLKFNVPINSIGMPINVEIGSIDMDGMTADWLPSVVNWIHDVYLYPGYGYVGNGYMGFMSVHELVVSDFPIQKIVYDGADFRYWALASFRTMVLRAGQYAVSDIVKGMLAINNLTMFTDRNGVTYVINRLSYWVDNNPALAIDDSDVIDHRNIGTTLDASRLLDSLDIFEGHESTKDKLIGFYRQYTDKFCSTIVFKLPPEYYRALLDVSPFNNLMLLPISLNNNTYFITKNNDPVDDDLLGLEAIGDYSGASRALVTLTNPNINITGDVLNGRITLRWDRVDFADEYEVYWSDNRNADFPADWILITTQTDIFFDISPSGMDEFYRIRALSNTTGASSSTDMVGILYKYIPSGTFTPIAIPFRNGRDKIEDVLYAVFKHKDVLYHRDSASEYYDVDGWGETTFALPMIVNIIPGAPVEFIRNSGDTNIWCFGVYVKGSYYIELDPNIAWIPICILGETCELQSFPAHNDDAILCFDDFTWSDYIDGHGWIGDVQILEHGKTYYYLRAGGYVKFILQSN